MDKIVIISFTDAGSRLNAALCSQLADGICEGYSIERFAARYGLLTLPEDRKRWIGSLWGQAAFVFVGAAGIAVRYIAPWVKDKFTDSPVVVVDEKGRFVIPLLSGHVGGAVRLAQKAALCLGAVPVITTATDVQGRFAVDVFAVENGLFISDRGLAKRISAAVLEGEKVGFYSEGQPQGLDIEGVCSCHSLEELERYAYGIAVLERCKAEAMQSKKDMRNILWLWKEEPRPVDAAKAQRHCEGSRRIVVGIGCRRGAAKEQLETGLLEVLALHGVKPQEVEAFASIVLKKEEPGIRELAKAWGAAFRTYTAKELQMVESVSSSSEFVKQTTGVDNVCERAAMYDCPRGQLIQPKICVEGAAFALVKRRLRILLFAGTTEGRELAEALRRLPVEVYISTATEYGRECIEAVKDAGDKAGMEIISGRMNDREIEEFIKAHQIHLAVDATHPFAREVTENISRACQRQHIEYVRCIREREMTEAGKWEHMVWAESVKAAVEYLKTTEGNIFIATGSKELKLYTEIPGWQKRCFARVLSTREAVEESTALGFKGAHLIAMQGPFTKEMNMAMLRCTKAGYFVTKESGKAGGFREKAEAAAETGVRLVVIGRPCESGLSVAGTIDYIKGL